MARLILLLLVVTLTALVSSAPHHDGTDHDHEHEEATDQDHDHPVLASADAKKAAVGIGGEAKARAARDTANDDKKESDHPVATTKDKDAEDGKPKHLLLQNSTTLIGGGRVVRDTQTQKPSHVVVGGSAPGPFLLQGEPLHTILPAGDISQEKSSEQHTKTKRESPPYPPPPPNPKYGKPQVQPLLDPTPAPGYKPRYNRDTKTGTPVAQKPVAATLADERPVQQDSQEPHADHTHSATKLKRETDQQTPLGAPISPPPPVHFKTEDGKEGILVLPPIPGGPLSPKQKRDTAGQEPHQHSHDIHTTVEGKPAVSTLPSLLGSAPPKQKRDTTSEKDKKQDENPATLTKAAESDEKDEKKEEHKQKRESYNLDHKETSHEVPLHDQPESSESKLSPPKHESEYSRHTRGTEKDTPLLAETHPAAEQSKSAAKHDDSQSKSQGEKKDA